MSPAGFQTLVCNNKPVVDDEKLARNRLSPLTHNNNASAATLVQITVSHGHRNTKMKKVMTPRVTGRFMSTFRERIDASNIQVHTYFAHVSDDSNFVGPSTKDVDICFLEIAFNFCVCTGDESKCSQIKASNG